MPVKNQIAEMTVRGLSGDGNGVGTIDGVAVFVPFSAVGDRLKVKVVSVRPRFAYGIIEEIIELSADRVEPECPFFGRCGGCSYMHISYAAELRAKQKVVEDALLRLGGINTEVMPIIPSPSQNRYRNKVQFPVFAENNGINCGLFAPRSHRVIPVGDCLLQPKKLNDVAADSCRILSSQGACAYNEETGKGLIRHICLRGSRESKNISLCLVINGQKLPHAEDFIKQITLAHPEVVSVSVNINTARTNVILGDKTTALFGAGHIHDELCGVNLTVSPDSFYQVNHDSAELLYKTAGEFCDIKKDETLLDLYCGTGTIGLSMAKECKKLVGVDIVRAAIDDAKKNAAANGFENCEFICGDAENAVNKLYSNGERFDAVITDPARKGCSPDTLRLIAGLNPSRVVMVSCNPATLARDLAALTKLGFKIEKVRPFDLFPRTAHVETVCLLTLI